MNIEKRHITTEFRALDDETRTVEGYAIRFGDKSHEIRDYFEDYREIIPSNVEFRYVDADLLAVWSHDMSQVLGRLKNNTLFVEKDNKGLRVKIDLPDTTTGRDAYQLIKRGDVNGMSFSFRSDDITWDWETKPPTRTVNSMTIFEVSPVATPAYPTTSIEARGFEVVKRALDERAEDLKKQSEVEGREADASAGQEKQETQESRELEDDTGGDDAKEQVQQEKQEVNWNVRQKQAQAKASALGKILEYEIGD